MNRMRKTVIAASLIALAAVYGAPRSAAQATWNERTELTFSDPVQIPGAVLPAGKYVFQLMPGQASRHVLQVLNADRETIATMLTVPIKRQDPNGDVVLRFASAAPGAAPALKAYFYPGSVDGHEFVYPESQARQIAQRSRTVVLSHDVEGSDFEKATLRLINDRGERRDYVVAAPGEANAPMVMASAQGTRVTLDDLEDEPTKYLGQRITVDAEIESVIGPRLFTIDERNWADTDGEILVFVPAFGAALVSKDDAVTVTGTMKPFVKAELEREWGLGGDAGLDADISLKPVLVADRVIGGNRDLAFKITPDPRPVGTSGAGKEKALTKVPEIAKASLDRVGADVSLSNVVVDHTVKEGGFWVRGGDGTRVFVLPMDRDAHKLTAGQRVSVEGVLLEMPHRMRERVTSRMDESSVVYVYATTVTM